MKKEVRVRYAPSPTGFLHIGNARTAMFNYLFAKNLDGKFIIRIEDTDSKRNVEGGEESQLRFLKWLGLDWDEGVDVSGEYGPYRQSERNDIYETYYKQLEEKGLAYKCYCTEEELEAEREAQTENGENPKYSEKCRHLTKEQQDALAAEGRKPSLRFAVQPGKVYTWNDMVKGELSFESDEIGDFVIVKKDGVPTYNFAVAIDDHLMEISHVLRGEEHISNTPKQLMIFESFGWGHPEFGHMTLIVNESRKKLSKRDGSILQFIHQYKELGYLPEALFNFIALLGWSPSGEEEIFSKEDFVRIFDAERLSKSPAMFDQVKLKWMNNQYVKSLSEEAVTELCLPFLQAAGKVSTNPTEEELAWAKTLIRLFHEQLSFGAEIVELTEMFFKDEVEMEEEGKDVLADEDVAAVLKEFVNQLEQLEVYSSETIKSAIKAVQKATGQKGKKLFMPIRVAATGQTHGRDLNDTLYLLGRERVVKRISEHI